MSFAWPSFPSLQEQHPDAQAATAKEKKVQSPRDGAVTERGGIKYRYCAYHKGDWDASDGKMLQLKRTSRWMCGNCVRVRAKRATKTE